MALQAHDLDDDPTLVRAVQAGDTEAYGELFRRHYPSVRRVCARRTGDLVEADEIAQAAFVRALERIHRCRGDRRFGAWVQVIALRLCVDAVRDRSRVVPEERAYDDRRPARAADPEESLLAGERTEEVHRALAMLPPRQRQVVVARHLEGRRPGEIAASLGLSLGAVDSLLLRARRRMVLSYLSVSREGGVVSSPGTLAGGTATGAAVAGTPRLAQLGGVVEQAVTRAGTGVADAMARSPGGGVLRHAAAAVAMAVATIVPAGAPRPSGPPGAAAGPAVAGSAAGAAGGSTSGPAAGVAGAVDGPAAALPSPGLTPSTAPVLGGPGLTPLLGAPAAVLPGLAAQAAGAAGTVASSPVGPLPVPNLVPALPTLPVPLAPPTTAAVGPSRADPGPTLPSGPIAVVGGAVQGVDQGVVAPVARALPVSPPAGVLPLGPLGH
jgi:RNA polymerase sigma-70 factor (ECF subfamily)